MSLFSELQELMIKYRFRPDMRFSQHFIIDENLLSRMVDAAQLKKSDVALEIGCGTGFLTKALLERCKVIGVENDRILAAILREQFGGNKKFLLLEEDFLELKKPRFNKVVALPPYGISTEIILKLYSFGFEAALLVFQREFVEKLVAEPGFYEYNYLSVLTRMQYNVSVLVRNISPMSFYPKPEAYSSLVLLTAKKKQPRVKEYVKLAFFVKSIFRFRNKNLSNALRSCISDLQSKLGVSEKKIFSMLRETGLQKEKVYLLSHEDILKLFTEISR